MEYEFKLTYKLDPKDSDTEDLMNKIFEAGCDDAIVGFGIEGQICLDFTRAAPSAIEAIESAINAMRHALPTAKLIEIGPDLVGLTDAANLLNMTRQNMRKLMTNNPMEFPIPVHAGTTSIWHLAPILRYLNTNQRVEKKADPALYEVAQSAMRMNFARQHAIFQEESQSSFA